jgi:hypothetical protein
MVTSWLQGTSTQVSLFTSRTMQTVYNHEFFSDDNMILHDACYYSNMKKKNKSSTPKKSPPYGTNIAGALVSLMEPSRGMNTKGKMVGPQNKSKKNKR